MSNPKHPMQPIVVDENGTKRFKANAIVRYLVNHGSINLNDIAALEFSQEDREQLAQLIGYSIGGFGELSYVSDETYEISEEMSAKLESSGHMPPDEILMPK